MSGAEDRPDPSEPLFSLPKHLQQQSKTGSTYDHADAFNDVQIANVKASWPFPCSICCPGVNGNKQAIKQQGLIEEEEEEEGDGVALSNRA